MLVAVNDTFEPLATAVVGPEIVTTGVATELTSAAASSMPAPHSVA